MTINHLERALELNPNDAESRASLGTTLHYAGRTSRRIGFAREGAPPQSKPADAANYSPR
jgi:Flp pilus assembly protein TadD